MSNILCVKQLSEKFMSSYSERNLKCGVRLRRDTNRAVWLFTQYVVENKNIFIDDRNCYDDMISTYLNILLYVEGEKKEINYALAKFEGLDEDTKQKILDLSGIGRYIGISRVGGSLPRDEQFRRKFLNLIEDFNSSKTFDQLMDRLDTFAIKTKSCARASITGILSALREYEFMVYNTRSVCPLLDTDCVDLADGCMVKYREFNDIYRNIGKATGWNLLELDTIANEMYFD